MAFGSCLGGNGTLIGASCNLVAAAIAEQHGCKITFKQFFLTGFPIMICSILVAVIYILITCIYLEWHWRNFNLRLFLLIKIFFKSLANNNNSV